MSDQQSPLRNDVLEMIEGGAAHPGLNRLTSGLPAELRGIKPAAQSHTPWRLIEHIRLAQHDILEFIRNPDHQSPPWPEGYWPDGDSPPDDQAWQASIEQFNTDSRELRQIVEDPDTDLITPIPHGEGQTILRQAMVVVDHNAYHLGQLATLRALLSV